MIPWQFNDGGRRAAGFKGEAPGDCVTRAIAIATGAPYQVVYDALNEAAKAERPGARARKYKGRRSSARTGVFKPTIRRYMESLGWRWVPTMQIGQGCKVHLRASELPAGRLVVNVSRHTVAVIDGVVHDTHDSSRGGTRCVYGYYIRDAEPVSEFDAALARVRTLYDSGAKWIAIGRADCATLFGFEPEVKS